MARQETVLSVFVASPSDVQDERDILEEVIQEINGTWSKNLGLRIELIRWETNAYPGIGSDAQDVINHQIEETFDIFIGIMWCRFGTPTLRSGSGTKEEFERAISRYRNNENSVSIMMYFKDEAIPPSKIDFDQAKLVDDFKKSLGGEGALYWIFKDCSDFEKLLRIHLTKKLQEWIPKKSTELVIHDTGVISIEKTANILTIEEDFGLLDTVELFEKEFEAIVEVSNRIGIATLNLGEKIRIRAEENNQLFKSLSPTLSIKDIKIFISRAAEDMNCFVNEMENEMPLFSQHNEAGMNAYIRAMEISTEFPLDKDSEKTMSEARNAVNFLGTILNGVENQLEEFKASIDALPRMTSELTKAKRNVITVLDKFIEHLQTAQNLAREAENSTPRIK